MQQHKSYYSACAWESTEATFGRKIKCRKVKVEHNGKLNSTYNKCSE
jgi:hypothetical protein